MPSHTGLRALPAIRRWTNGLTMYRLVLTCLGGLAAVSVGCALVGAIPYPPLALLASLGVVVLACYCSNWAIAAMFGVVPHSESALITAFLLFFIFPPSTSPGPLLGLALAALLASASKYILALRGRHIFNPAAAGAFLLTLTGISYSAWWAGSPVLLPFTTLVAVLVLRRVRRATMALIFVAVAGGIMVLRSLLVGIDLATAASWPLTSSPLIFFAGLMLSEPLTQPPLRWQQLTFAALVGCLFSIPMHAGPVYIAPESALLVGNALAFLLGQRRGIELILQRRSQLTATTLEFAFRPTRELKFRPGQYLELTLPHKSSDNRGVRRVFSIASAPNPTGLLRIGTKVPARASTFKQTLQGLAEGTVVTATSIAGDFLLPRDPRMPLLLVAGGIGITPFASQLADLPRGHGRDIVLLHSIADPQEVSYQDVLEESGVRVLLVSAVALVPLPAGWGNIHASRVDRSVLVEHVPDISRRHVLVSGPPAMVAGVGAAARTMRARSVRTDYFSGY